MKCILLLTQLIVLFGFNLIVLGQQSEASSQPTGSSTPSVANSPLSGDLNRNERFEYDKLRLQRDLQKELLDWAQTRFWILAVLAFLIGFFGVRALVREMISSELKDATLAAAQARAAADQTRDFTKEVRSDADKYRETVAQLSETATRVDDRFKELDARISAEGAHAVASSELQLSQLGRRVDELSEVIKSATLDSKETREALKKYEMRLAALNSEAEDQRVTFLNNSEYLVTVVSHPSESKNRQVGKALVKELTKRGFRASDEFWSESHSTDVRKIDIDHGNKPLGRSLAEIVLEVLRDQKLDLPVEPCMVTEDQSRNQAIIFVQ